METSTNVQYPILGAALQAGSLAKRQSNTKLLLYVADLVNKDESNETEVLSDTQLILMDVYAQFWEYLEENSIELSPDATFSSFTERWDSEVSGWQIEVDIKQFYSRDTCQVPSRFIDGEVTETAQILTSLVPDLPPNTYTLLMGQETPVFKIFGVRLLPNSGNLTVTLDAELEFYNGTTWASSGSIPYINGQINTAEIYKVRRIGSNSIANFSISSTYLNYSLVFYE